MSLVTTLPNLVGQSTTDIAATIYVDQGAGYDYAIGGIPFYSAASPKTPMVRKTAEYKKEQVDTGIEPGEQSILQWWIKSQSSFHAGAGQLYIDTPDREAQEIMPLRYNTSSGVNPWVRGKISLLPTTTRAATAAAGAHLLGATDGVNNWLLLGNGSALSRIAETISSGTPTYTPTAITWGGSGSILSLASDGYYYYAANSTTIYRGSIASGSGSAIYTLPAGVTSIKLRWVKQRLMCALTCTAGSFVYELQANPGSLQVLTTAPTYSTFVDPKFTHPNPQWTWTSITEGPSAIYAAGFSGGSSSIYKFVLDTSGATPTLSTGGVACDLPTGEIVYSINGYMSTAIGVQTSRGFRVGQFSSNGDFLYGPLSIDSAFTAGSMVGKDRFFYAGYTHADGTAGVARVDVSQQLALRQFAYTPDERFAWAPDLRAMDGSELPVAGAVTAVTLINGRCAFLVSGVGVYVEHPTKLLPSGTLATSRIRFTTLDPKVFRFIHFRGEATSLQASDSGSITVAVASDTDGPGQTVGIMSIPAATDSGDLPCNVPRGTYAVVNFTLARSVADVTAGPVLLGYQLRALPAQKRQRQFVVPLSCFDRESDSTGQKIGWDGRALQFLSFLEQIEERGDIITFQSISPHFPDQNLSRFVVIENLEFQQSASPTDRDGWGGLLLATLRSTD